MPPVPDRSTELTLASLNVAGLPSTLPPLRSRAAEIGARLAGAGVDVVNLQEVWTYPQLAVLRSALSPYRYVARRRGPIGPAGGLVTFSRRPVGPGSFTSFRAARVGAGSAMFRTRQTLNSHLQGVLTVAVDGVTIANTHLTANRDGDWSAGARHETLHRTQLDILHRVARERGVRVLSGDFNVPSTSHLYPWVVDGGVWRDPFAEADPVTYQPSFLPSGRSSSRIDYVLVSDGVTVRETGLLFAEPREDGTYLSDHIGLRVRVGWVPRPGMVPSP